MAVRHEGPGHLHTAGPHAPTRASTRGHDIFRPPAFASRSSFARRGVRPSSRSADRPTGPDPDGVSAFRTSEQRPGWAPSVPRGQRCSPRPEPLPDRAPAASQRTSPFPRPPSHRQGCGFAASTKGSHVSPVRSSPRLWPPRMERAALGLAPGLRTPPTKSQTTHARAGTGHRARTWNHQLNSHPSISNPVVHS